MGDSIANGVSISKAPRKSIGRADNKVKTPDISFTCIKGSILLNRC